MRSIYLVWAVAFFSALGAVRRASACASCSCGDATLTTVGVEQPYKNRVRLALEERVDTHDMGERRALTLRSTLGVAWSPIDRLTLAASLPWIASWLVHPDAPTTPVSGLGDLEVTGRVVVWRSRRFAPEHLVWLIGGVKAPTGPRVMSEGGYPIPDDDQPGSGSWDPSLGLAYGWFGRGMTSVFLSTTGRGTTPNGRGYRRGAAWNGAAWVQVQPRPWFATSLGADVTWREHDTLKSGMPSPDSGGTFLRILPSLVFSPHSNVLLRVGAAIPIVQVMNGRQSEGPQLLVTLAWDVH